ncbi:metallopeptidase family protein [Phenylobacterium sp.]|uniref:metallopeptidase family protein n=1 Tax=Phenylobacterium sp. TaxID=1871053 RepID=UPI0025DC6512|nr:metallopeptidase family protein [Phenylobacterium sp.]
MNDPDASVAGRAPSLDDLAEIAERAFAALPEGFRKLAGDVVFRVDDFASDEILAEMGIEDPFDLTGLYSGVSLADRSGFGAEPEPSRIFLYRRPILDEWAEHGEVTLEELVSHVLVHEIGHHFGLSDPDIEAIEASA